MLLLLSIFAFLFSLNFKLDYCDFYASSTSSINFLKNKKLLSSSSLLRLSLKSNSFKKIKVIIKDLKKSKNDECYLRCIISYF